MTEQDLQIRGASAVNQICTQKFSETKKNDFQLSQNRNQKIEDFLSIFTEKITIINHSKIEAYRLTSLETQQKYLDDQTKDKDIQVQSETQQNGISNLANLKSSIFGNKVLKKRLWVQKEQNNKENFPQPFCIKNKFQNLIKSRPQNYPEPPQIKIPKLEPTNFNLIMKQVNILNNKDSQNVRVIPQQDVSSIDQICQGTKFKVNAISCGQNISFNTLRSSELLSNTKLQFTIIPQLLLPQIVPGNPSKLGEDLNQQIITDSTIDALELQSQKQITFTPKAFLTNQGNDKKRMQIDFQGQPINTHENGSYWNYQIIHQESLSVEGTQNSAIHQQQ
eukprot:403343224